MAFVAIDKEVANRLLDIKEKDIKKGKLLLRFEQSGIIKAEDVTEDGFLILEGKPGKHEPYLFTVVL